MGHAAPQTRSGATSAWAPFRHPLFAAMWSAQFVSNIGSWMQTVGAQWLMLTLTGSVTYVALVQTAASLPVLLFAFLAGVVGDLLDRRRLLLVTQTLMLVAATALGILAVAGRASPWVTLALIFAVGVGQTLTAPTWQTLQPELVTPPERAQAISLGSVNQNLARAIGPALGGAVVAATGASGDFLINAATFLAVIGVLVLWKNTTQRTVLPPEHVVQAFRAGGRYVAASPALRAILLRAGVLVVAASSIWALLPVTAQSQLHLGSNGYGLLLGCVGIGAVGGALLLPRLRSRLTPDTVLTSSSLGLAVVAGVLAVVHVTVLVAIALLLAGLCWVLSLSTLNALYQLTLPRWVRARGMSFYLVVFQGGNAVGSAVLGLVAQSLGLTTALLAAAAVLALGPLAGLRFRFRSIPPEGLLPAGDWPEPQLVDPDTAGGPVLVTVVYSAQAGREADLLTALRELRNSRRRTGASSWRVWRDGATTGRVLEQFVVASWVEHLRQHERVTLRDQARLDRLRDMTDPAQPPVVTHWVAPSHPRP